MSTRRIPQEHKEALRHLREVLEVPDCNCRIRRVHSIECDIRHQAHTKDCNERHSLDCVQPGMLARDGKCFCDRGCSCPFEPLEADDRNCDCLLDLSDRCPHVKAADNVLPFYALRRLYEGRRPGLGEEDGWELEVWEIFLTENFGGEYFFPGKPPRPAVAHSREQRIAILTQRERRFSFEHPLDKFTDDDFGQQCRKANGGTGRIRGEVRRS